MYIQPSSARSPLTGLKNDTFQVPEGYSGNAFLMPSSPEADPSGGAQAPPDGAKVAAQQEEAAPEHDAEPATPTAATAEADAIPTSGGLLTRFPLLSSLLPPKRQRRGRGEGSDLLLLGALLLFLWESPDNDLLPFLLILLLWD